MAARRALASANDVARASACSISAQNRAMFEAAPAWRALQPLTLAERLARLADRSERRRLAEGVALSEMTLDFDRVCALLPGRARYDMNPAGSLGAIARRRGVDAAPKR